MRFWLGLGHLVVMVKVRERGSGMCYVHEVLTSNDVQEFVCLSTRIGHGI